MEDRRGHRVCGWARSLFGCEERAPGLSVGNEEHDWVVKETKTRQTRSMRPLAPLATDLAEWRLACGRPDGKALVFPGREGRLWADHDWRNRRKRVYAPAAAGVQLDRSRPHDLRHAFCSLLTAEGLSLVEIAQQAGHSPAMTLATYAHVIDELAGTERRPAGAVIRDAREKLAFESAPGRRTRSPQRADLRGVPE